ncbi:hypothetical protein B0H13DRAFT_2327093 [Mycena leptocephala]|nr:hypothetical protein B0H13DRAFT_2327093 [Mycena leptocephala]
MQAIGGDIHLPFTLHVQLHRLVLSKVTARGKRQGIGSRDKDVPASLPPHPLPPGAPHPPASPPPLHPHHRPLLPAPGIYDAKPAPAASTPTSRSSITPHPLRDPRSSPRAPDFDKGRGASGLGGGTPGPARRLGTASPIAAASATRRGTTTTDALRVYGLHVRRRRDHDTLHRTYRARVLALLLLLPPFSLPGVDRRSTTPAPIIPSLLEPPPGHTYARTSAFGQRPILTHRPLPHPLHPTLNPAAGPQDGRTASAPRCARTRSSAHRGVGARRDSGGRGSAGQREDVIHRVVGVD